MKIQKERGRIKISVIINVILVVISMIIIYKMWHIYRINDFGNFIKAEYAKGISEFTRDDTIKCSDKYSYKINSQEFNDALIYKTIQVEPNTVYKVTAKVKFENVEKQKSESEGGVNICIMNTTEKSDSLLGNGEWQEISFMFNSKNRTIIDIAFRLGAYDDNSKGTVWFSDFTLEKGIKNTSKNWNFICLIMKNLEVDIDKNGTKTKMTLTPSEILLIENNMKRFQTSMKEMSRKSNDCYLQNIYS